MARYFRVSHPWGSVAHDDPGLAAAEWPTTAGSDGDSGGPLQSGVSTQGPALKPADFSGCPTSGRRRGFRLRQENRSCLDIDDESDGGSPIRFVETLRQL
jgi:hypothetical protein